MIHAPAPDPSAPSPLGRSPRSRSVPRPRIRTLRGQPVVLAHELACFLGMSCQELHLLVVGAEPSFPEGSVFELAEDERRFPFSPLCGPAPTDLPPTAFTLEGVVKVLELIGADRQPELGRVLATVRASLGVAGSSNT